MKNLALVGLMLVASVGHAAHSKNIRLQLAQKSFGGLVLPVASSTVKLITVDGQGKVKGARCQQDIDGRLGVGKRVYRDCVEVRVLETLSKAEQRNLEVQIREAKLGQIIYPDPRGIHCLAIPTHSVHATADNGNVLLKAGSFPCGMVTYNKSEAAQSLVGTLNGYLQQYNRLVGAERE